ncbi:MAG: CotH kinase family protein [Myxococcota bacterium]
MPDPDAPAQERLCQVDVQCWGSILDEPKAPCELTVTDGDGTLAYQGSAGFELRGRSSLYFPKKQYSLELRDHTELPVWPGATWQYLDDGTDPGASWSSPGFDDGRWGSGAAPMGSGADWLQTVLQPTLTTYFRKNFTVGDLSQVTRVEIGVKSTGGVAVYVGGVEVIRQDLVPEAAPDTPAFGTIGDGSTWSQFEIDPSLLVAGDNQLAVEVHRQVLEEDLRFDLYLEATGEDHDADLLGMGADDEWILNGQYVDRALFRNRLAYDLFQSFGGPEHYATETRFCEMTLDGEYLGVYTLGEKLERGEDRLPLGKGEQPGESFLVKLDDDEGFHDNTAGYGTWQLVWPDEDPEVLAAVSTILAGWEAASGDDIFAWVDLDSAVDWVLLQEFMKNNDAYFLSVYLWRDSGGKLHFAPWDFDLTLGGYPIRDCGAEGWNPRTWYGTSGDPVEIDYIQKMDAVPAFRDRLVTRWNELRQGELSEASILARIEGYDAVLAPAIPDQVARWPVDEISFAPAGEDWLCPSATYDEEHEHVLSFISERLAWMDAHIGEF